MAFSGKGIVRNYGDTQTTSENTMPSYYNQTLVGNTDVYWDPNSHRMPNVVSIALGTNDYSTEPHPSDDDFINAYLDFITQIKDDYPRAKILCICEPNPQGNQEANIRTVASMAGAEFLRIDDSIYSYGVGCDGHPNAKAQQAISKYVIPKLQEMLQR